MLSPSFTGSGTRQPLARQGGVALIVSLIVLVAMTLAALALMRSTDTNTVIAGNLAFQKAASHAAEVGIEDAIAWLEAQSSLTLQSDQTERGYSASGAAAEQNPASGQSWDEFWKQTLINRSPRRMPPDAAGNTVSYVIDRMCQLPKAITDGAGCGGSAAPLSLNVIKPPNPNDANFNISDFSENYAKGGADSNGDVQLNPRSVVYYRITARVVGPRNTVSYVQAMIAM